MIERLNALVPGLVIGMPIDDAYSRIIAELERLHGEGDQLRAELAEVRVERDQFRARVIEISGDDKGDGE